MSGVGRDGADELGLAEVAWELRTTLATAGDVKVAGDEKVLATIRRRSTQRRRAKRVLSTSMAAFALSLSTLAVVKGGQVAIDHGIAGNAEPPAVTPGNASDGPGASKVTEPTTPGTQARNKKGPNDCRPDPHNGVVPCQPTSSTDDPNSTAPGGPIDPTKPTAADGPTPGPTSTVTPSTAAPTTKAAPPSSAPPTPGSSGKVYACDDITPAAAPPDPLCFKKGYEAGDKASVKILVPDATDPAKLVQRLWETQPGNTWVWLEIQDPAASLNPRYQCPVEYLGHGPEWYAMTAQCQRVR